MFWQEIDRGYEPQPSIQALVFSAWFSAIVAMGDAEAVALFDRPKPQLVEEMKVATELALTKANVLRTTRIETMQALVMYMVRFLP